MKCMILAAGYGKRMMPLTKETPKPLLKIGNETLLDRNIKHVLSNGFDEIIILSLIHISEPTRPY